MIKIHSGMGTPKFLKSDFPENKTLVSLYLIWVRSNEYVLILCNPKYNLNMKAGLYQLGFGLGFIRF